MEEKTIEVPENVLVECPKTGKFKKFIRVTQCFNSECEHYRGLLSWVEGDPRDLPFPGRFAVLCAYPRALGMIEEAE